MLTVAHKLGDYEYVQDQKSIPFIIADAKKEKYLGVDTENSGGLDILVPGVTLLLFQIEVGGKAYVIDARRVDLSPFKEILEDDNYIKIVQNANYDYKMIRVKAGINLNGIYDTRIAEYLLNVGISREGNSLGVLSKKYLDVDLDKSITMTFAEFPYEDEFTDEQIMYAADDVLVLPGIKRRQQMYLNQLGLNSIADLEFKLVPAVAKMELNGMKIDAIKWRKSLENTRKKLFKVVGDLRQVLPDPPAPPAKPVRLKKDGTPFANSAAQKPDPILNLDSPMQLATSCSEVGIDLEKANKKTRRGLTNTDTLKYAKELYRSSSVKLDVLSNIIKYRGLKQTEKTFGENLLDHIRPDGRIHARFHQNGTESGRFSSSAPNLQNIQKKGEEGKILRSCFIPEFGHKFIIADYSQIELRIAAEMSGDPTMISILQDPKGDIHRGTASKMYGIPYDKVTSAIRGAAKTLNFGLIYGMSVKTLSERLGCSSDEAAEHLKRYEETYPVLMAWLEKQGTGAFESGFSKTIGGRIRWFPSLDINDENYRRMKGFYERVGRNHPIQGTSADMTKTSMVFLDRLFDNYLARMINTVHDELCVEVPCKHTIPMAQLVKRKMIFAGQQYLKKVPILVDVKIRDCWFKDDGVEDTEEGQQLWLIPNNFGLDDVN